MLSSRMKLPHNICDYVDCVFLSIPIVCNTVFYTALTTLNEISWNDCKHTLDCELSEIEDAVIKFCVSF